MTAMTPIEFWHAMAAQRFDTPGQEDQLAQAILRTDSLRDLEICGERPRTADLSQLSNSRAGKYIIP